jgi:AraC family transcriptional regulator
LAKIAIALEQALERRAETGTAGPPAARLVAAGDGWMVEDVVCTSGPGDRPYEERHSHVRVAIVAAGSFQYRADCRNGIARELMTPGSVLLATQGQCFECGHDYGVGDRCLSFGYRPDYFESLTGAARGNREFRVVRLPPMRDLSPLVARACAGVAGDVDVAWEELSVELGVRAVQLASASSSDLNRTPPGATARVTQIVRRIERNPDSALTLRSLAHEAGLSPFHFLRTFEHLTGVTPHQYVLRTRLREAAMRLMAGPDRILEIALDCGFGDVSNFNRTFRAEFGVSPRVYRDHEGTKSFMKRLVKSKTHQS